MIGGGDPFYLKLIALERNRRFSIYILIYICIFARSASAVTPSKTINTNIACSELL